MLKIEKEKVVNYEVYCITSDMSDVCEYDTLEKAELAAKDWSQYSNCPVVIDKVEAQIIKVFKNGKEEK